MLGILGAGAQYGVLLPFSRKHELEADQIGLTYMASAGYDPRESVVFWKRMMTASRGSKPPELMSTHPADDTRINQLERLMPAPSRSIEGPCSDSPGFTSTDCDEVDTDELIVGQKADGTSRVRQAIEALRNIVQISR